MSRLVGNWNLALRAVVKRTALDIKTPTHDRLKVTRDLYGFKSFDEMLIALDDSFRKQNSVMVPVKITIAADISASTDITVTQSELELVQGSEH